jgi:hydrogenase maturation protease
MKRIICVGNRFSSADQAGPLVHDWLAKRRLPPDVELIDGGLAGLDLLRFVEGAETVVFVDAVTGYGTSDGVCVLDPEEAARYASGSFDHAAGLGYLLRVLPCVCEKTAPVVSLVGIEGVPTAGLIAEAGELGLKIAAAGPQGRDALNHESLGTAT